MSGDEAEQLAEDALQVAQRALAQLHEEREAREELESTVDRLVERVGELEVKTATDDRAYETLSRNEKVGMVREHLHRRAQAAGGRSQIDYDDIVWEVFNGEPSADHAYTLMSLAAEAEGFRVRNPDDGNKHLAVDIDDASAGAAFSRANNPAGEEAR